MVRVIGIRREDKNKWERRVPLIPEDIQSLKSRFPQLEFIVQPSQIRAFPESAFSDVGAIIDENLERCDVVFGVKEMPADFFRPGKVYIFFSHTIKGQKNNMPMLKSIIEKKCTLIDYEKITNDKGQRLVFFGRYAGIAGMVDTLWTFAKKLNSIGISTPFEKIELTYKYNDLNDLKKQISEIGNIIFRDGIAPELHPLVIGFTGYGNVSKGAQEILELLPCEEISPEELLAGKAMKISSKKLVKVVFKEQHTVKPKLPNSSFDLKEYFENPEKYESIFRQYVDFLTILVNCIFWTPKSPKLLTKSDAQEIWGIGKKPKLMVIGDISCDIEGGIEFTLKATDPDNPIFTYNPQTGTAVDGIGPNGPIIMAVDNLPCELPKESSYDFSKALTPLIPGLLQADFSAKFENAGLSPEMKRATIVWNGELTPDYSYLQKFLV